jgi:hypothetical protein
VSYHHAGDQPYYDAFSRQFHDGFEALSDNSLERAFDSENSDYVMRRIRERHITGTSCTIVLCGAGTRWRKYCDWEIAATLCQQGGLLGIKLPTLLVSANGGCNKPDRLQDNIDSGYAVWAHWEQINANPAALRQLIEEANARPKRLIDNRRPRRVRNA